MPSIGVWADRVEGRVVRSPSEAVSGPQACESEAPEAAKTHTQILIYAHAHKCMYPYLYKHMRTDTHADSAHIHTHTVPSRASQRGRLRRAGTRSSVWKPPPPPQEALGTRKALASGYSEGSTGLPQRSRAPSPPRQPLLSWADSSSPHPTTPCGPSSEHRCRHLAGHHDVTSLRQADQRPLMFSPARDV